MFLFYLLLVNEYYTYTPRINTPVGEMNRFMQYTTLAILQHIWEVLNSTGLIYALEIYLVILIVVKLNTILEWLIELVRFVKSKPVDLGQFFSAYFMGATAHILMLEYFSPNKVPNIGWLWAEPLTHYQALSITTATPINYAWYANFTLRLDALSTPFFLTTLMIGILSYFFAAFYMQTEVYKTRFLKLLLMFLGSMLLLLASGNLITLFLGWELIGLVSFLLINFWTVKTTSLKSAFKALTYNQLSDGALLLYIIIVMGVTQNYDLVSNTATTTHDNVSLLAAILLCVCVSCKSAQAPFHYWLPDSMEAPIPASALIHSATLVSAGVFLILRLEQYHIYENLLTNYLVCASLLTILVGGFGAVYQNDLKKILAYSTISNCGFIMLFAILNKKTLCFLYFFVHGLFKALSFLVIGTLVILLNHKQDWRYLNLRPHTSNSVTITLTTLIMLLGAWPGTITSYIKHLNVFTTTTTTTGLNELIVPTLLVGSALSLAYSMKIICVLFQFNTKTNIVLSGARYESAETIIRHQNPTYLLVASLALILLLPLVTDFTSYRILETSTPVLNSTSKLVLVMFGLLNVWLVECYKRYTPGNTLVKYAPYMAIYLYLILTTIL